MIVNAFKKWRDHAGILAIWGMIAYASAMILGSATYIILAPISRMIAVSFATTVLILTYGILGTIIAGAVENGHATMESIWKRIKEKWIDVGIATVFSWTPFIVGLLTLLAAVLYTINGGSEGVADVGLIVFVLGWLGSVAAAVAPYIADAKSWKASIEESWSIAKEKYITLILLAILFDVIYIIYLALLPTPLGWVLAALDATVIMHVRNIAFYEVTEVTHSVSARG